MLNTRGTKAAIRPRYRCNGRRQPLRVGVDRVDALEQRQRSILIGGSSTNRLPKHRVVPADVCDAQYPVLRPSYVPDIDCNRSPPGPGPVAKAEGPKSRLRCVSAIRTRLEGRRQIITYANTC